VTFNRQGEDWRLMRIKLSEMVATARGVMESGTTFEEYNFFRGQIMAIRQICEWADPTTPPVTVDDDYGISDPDAEE
jgi:hypothetical protein